MRLYVCWGTFPYSPRPDGKHPCGSAYRALRDAGHDPEVVRSYGFAPLPDFLNFTRGRREVRRLTGKDWVPALVLDDDTVIAGSREIAQWAHANKSPAIA